MKHWLLVKDKKRWILALLFILVVVALACKFLTGTINESGYQYFDTVSKLKAIGEGLQAFRTDFKRYPSTEEGLVLLVGKKDVGSKSRYIDEIPKDGWGHAFVYRNSNGDAHPFELYSIGVNKVDEIAAGDDIDFWTLTQ